MIHSNGSAKLNPQLVREMLRLRAEGWSYPRLARHFGVSENTVAKICRGTAWRSVTGGHEILTDGEAQLRALTTPMPSEEVIQASMDRFQRLMKEQEQQEQQSTVPPQYQRPQGDYAAALGELIKQAGENRAQSGPAPQPVPMRQVPVDSGKIDADRLLETLKNEHARDVGNVPPATPE